MKKGTEQPRAQKNRQCIQTPVSCQNHTRNILGRNAVRANPTETKLKNKTAFSHPRFLRFLLLKPLSQSTKSQPVPRLTPGWYPTHLPLTPRPSTLLPRQSCQIVPNRMRGGTSSPCSALQIHNLSGPPLCRRRASVGRLAISGKAHWMLVSISNFGAPTLSARHLQLGSVPSCVVRTNE